jgi:hypothetical protein
MVTFFAIKIQLVKFGLKCIDLFGPLDLFNQHVFIAQHESDIVLEQ